MCSSPKPEVKCSAHGNNRVWSVLFTTGYLTQAGKVERSVYKLIIPNREVRLSFINLSATRDTYARRIAIPLQGDCFDKLRTEYTGMLWASISFGIMIIRRSSAL